MMRAPLLRTCPKCKRRLVNRNHACAGSKQNLGRELVAYEAKARARLAKQVRHLKGRELKQYEAELLARDRRKP